MNTPMLLSSSSLVSNIQQSADQYYKQLGTLFSNQDHNKYNDMKIHSYKFLLDNVFTVRQLLETCDFSEGTGRNSFVGILRLSFLERHHLTCCFHSTHMILLQFALATRTCPWPWPALLIASSCSS